MFNSPLSGTTQVSQYHKGKINLDFTEARGSGWQWHQLGHNASLHLAPNITMPTPHHSVFYRPDALPATQPTASKHCSVCIVSFGQGSSLLWTHTLRPYQSTEGINFFSVKNMRKRVFVLVSHVCITL